MSANKRPESVQQKGAAIQPSVKKLYIRPHITNLHETLFSEKMGLQLHNPAALPDGLKREKWDVAGGGITLKLMRHELAHPFRFPIIPLPPVTVGYGHSLSGCGDDGSKYSITRRLRTAKHPFLFLNSARHTGE